MTDRQIDELTPHYLFVWGKVEERIDPPEAPDRLPNGRVVHTYATDQAQRCDPQPDKVVFVEPFRQGSQVLCRTETIFEVSHELTTPPSAPADIDLEQALHNFIDVAYPGGWHRVYWRGERGLNQAIRELLRAYFREYPDKQLPTDGSVH